MRCSIIDDIPIINSHEIFPLIFFGCPQPNELLNPKCVGPDAILLPSLSTCRHRFGTLWGAVSVPGRTNWGLMTWRLKKVVQHEENHVKPRKNVIGAHTYAKNGFVILVDSRADITGCKNLCADRDMGCFNDSTRRVATKHTLEPILSS